MVPMSAKVSGNVEEALAAFADLAALRDEPLDPELEEWVEEGMWGPMLRHPLVYALPLINGYANRALRYKQEALAKAEEEQDWSQIIWLHERPHRLAALINYCVGRDENLEVTPLVQVPEHWDLATDVWVDSENIQQNIDQWRRLFGDDPVADGLWLGGDDGKAAFDALPKIHHKDGPLIQAWRGGSVGDWSWTTDLKTAEFFSARSGLPVRGHQIPVSDVFGYLTQRSEYELLVKWSDFRAALVYPEGDD